MYIEYEKKPISTKDDFLLLGENYFISTVLNI